MAGEPRRGDEQWNWQARQETPEQRLDRNFGELLQELRVAQTGVQILFAFLLTLAFTQRFEDLTATQRDIYIVALVAAALATALFTAPVSYHRLLFRRRRKAELVRVGSLLAVGGLLLLMVGVAAAVLLIVDVVLGRQPAVALTAGVVAWYVAFWYGLPLWSRRRGGTG